MRGVRRVAAVLSVALLLAVPVTAAGEQGLTSDRSSVDSLTAFTRAKQAYEEGKLEQAGRAIQEAYLQSPEDPEIQSWMNRIRTAQERQQAIDSAITGAKTTPSQTPASAGPASVYEQEPPIPPMPAAVSAPASPPLSPGEIPVEDKFYSAPPPAYDEAPAAGSEGGGRRFFEFGRLLMPPEEGRFEVLETTKRAGFQRFYKEGIGLQPIRGLGLSARTEIYEEPNPLEDYILEAKILNLDSLAAFRSSLTPLFTRSWAVRAVADYEPLPRFTYEFDRRDVYHEFQTRFNFKNRNLDTHAIHAMYSFPPVPLLGVVSVNPWYKRVLQGSDQDSGSFETRDEVILNFSVKPVDTFEYFFQYNAFGASKTEVVGGSKLKLFKTQLRMQFPKLKLFVIPSAEYSDTDFDPNDDEFTKRDFFVDWGFDITDRLRASSKQQIVTAEVSRPGTEPANPDAEVFNTFNKFSYEIFKDFDVSLGFDYSKAAGLNAYDNYGFRTELELFKPGFVRASVGFERLWYYNIDDELNLLYFRLFMFQ